MSTPAVLSSARRIGLFLRWGIGDLVMELPALRALRQAAPHAHISAVGAYPALQLLEGEGLCDELLSTQGFGVSHWGDAGDRAARGRIEAWLAGGRFDLLIDPSHANIALRDAAWQSGLPVLDLYREAEERAIARCGGGPEAIRSAALECWGVSVAPGRPRIEIGAPERAWAERYLASHRIEGLPLASISPVASSELKRWPVERFAALADRLAQRFGALLLAAGDQAQAAGRLLAAMRAREQVRVIGPLHLRRVAALLARCAVHVGNDTGLTHLARAVGCRVLGIYGPTSARLYAPPGSVAVGQEEWCPVRRIDRVGPPDCVVQGRCLEPGGRCIDRIPLEVVLAHLEGWLESPDEQTEG